MNKHGKVSKLRRESHSCDSRRPFFQVRSDAMKVIIYAANRMSILFLIYVASLLCATVLFSHFESKTLFEAFYWSCTTSLTIGYGDLSPSSVSGRLVMIVFGHFWIFGIFPAIIASIVSKIIVDTNRFTHAEQEYHEWLLVEIARKNGIILNEPPPPDF
jgi:voltage-gated potassium channel